MKKRGGFTLAELVLAVMIFGFLATSLATIYSTSHRHMFQNYRANIIKTNVGLAMRAIQNNMAAATRIDVPSNPVSLGVAATSGNILAFAANVDQTSGCHPVGPGGSTWHYFCVAPDPSGQNGLFYHTGTIAAAGGCPQAAGYNFMPTYPTFCGFGGGGTVMLLMQAVDTRDPLFSRSAAAPDVVRIHLRSLWSPSDRGFGKQQRDIDFALDSAVQAHIYAR